MSLPNFITIFRIFLMPLYLYFFYSNMEHRLLYAGLVFVVAGISDVLDGYIARNYDMKTKMGAVLDPLADKIVVFTILISFTHQGIIPKWVLGAMGLKEAILIIGGAILYLFKGNKVMPSDKFGKFATVLFYISIVSIVIGAPRELSKTLLITTVIFNVITLLHYSKIFFKIDSK